MTVDQSAFRSAGKQLQSTRFAGFHRWDRNFFLGFLLICWLGVAMGFFPAAVARFHGKANFPAPPILQVHAFAFVGWLVLLGVQILLVRRLRHRQHMALGMAGFALLPVMLISGLWSEQITQRFHFDHPPHNLAFFIVPIFYLTGLAVFGIAALLQRRKPAAHKRLILLATSVIVGAAYGRWWGDTLYEVVGDGFWGMIVSSFSGLNLILMIAAAYDWATRRRIHPVYKAGIPAILAAELATSFIYHSPAWLPVAQFMIGR